MSTGNGSVTVVRVKENALIPPAGATDDLARRAIADCQLPLLIPRTLSTVEKTKVGVITHKWVICRQLLFKKFLDTKIKVSCSRAYQKELAPFVEWLKELYLLAKETHALQRSLQVPLLNPEDQRPYSDAGALFALVLNELEESDLLDVLYPTPQQQRGQTTKRKEPLKMGAKEAAIVQLQATRDALKSREISNAINPGVQPHLFALLTAGAELADRYNQRERPWSDMVRAYAKWIREIERGNWTLMVDRGETVMIHCRRQGKGTTLKRL